MEILKNAIYQISGDDLIKFADYLIAKSKQELTEEKQKKATTRRKQEEGYTTDEVAKKLGVCKRTLANWAKVKYLEPIKMGKRLRYRKSEVDRLVRLTR